ncbi:hypothetical protein ACWGLE_18895 [Streptomyces sp. NPDC055897]
MTGEPQSPAPLTDEQRVTQQVAVTDIATATATALSHSFPSGGRAVFSGARTDFEGHRLNEMLDLVHPAQPGHLLDAGHALRAAHGAIDAAAAELDGHIANVEWKGESGEAFRTWGKNLASHARKLADFAGTAGVQISAAGEGLVSVKSALPPRDHRADPVRVTDIPPMRRVAGNAEYEAAVRVEKDRQEAINQLNRLSSFYTVSQQNLASLEAPVFEVMPGVGVPKPLPGFGNDPREPIESGPPAHPSARASLASHHSVDHSGLQAGPDATDQLAHEVAGTPASVKSTVLPAGTELTSISTRSAATKTMLAVGPQPYMPTPPEGDGLPPRIGDFVPPTAGGSMRALRPGGADFRARMQSAEESSATTGQAVSGPASRTGDRAAGVARGGTSSTGETSRGPGVPDGGSRAGGEGSPRVGSTSQTTTGRNGGIFGGRPTASPRSSAASRTSTGTVVGDQGAPSSSNATSRQAQRRGVVGAAEQPSARARFLSNADGVTGKPQARTAGSRSSRNGFSPGGMGLVRGAGQDGSCRSGEEEGDDPDHVAEGETPPSPGS